LHEGLGKSAFWCWIVGFYVAFMPLYVLGFMGMTRRLQHYDVMAWQPYLIVAAIGGGIIAVGIALQILQLVVSIKNRQQNQDKTGDIWDGRTLEWSIPSPAPFYNFAVTPIVQARDSFWHLKQRYLEEGGVPINRHYTDVHMPKNTATGFIIAAFAGAFGFAMIWHIMWMVAFGLIGIIATVIVRSFATDIDYIIPAAEIERLDNLHRAQ
jgi:cytochrome o ubiquinol oxidase subunit 1